MITGSALFGALRSSIATLASSGAIKKYAALVLVVLFAWLLLFALLRLVRQCLHESAGEPALKKGRFFFASFLEGIFYTAALLPKIAVALVILFVLNALFSLGMDIQRLFSAQKQIKELSAVVKNLSRMDDIARITLLDDNLRTQKGTRAKRYKIEILALDGSVLSEQVVAMEGEELFIDSVNINFDYAEIGSGRVQNIAYPYRVYTEKIPANYGVLLTCMFNDENVPVLFLLTDDEVYGIEKPAFAERVREFSALLSDDEAAAAERNKLGIRSFNGVAVHALLEKGVPYIVRAEATGGISLHRASF